MNRCQMQIAEQVRGCHSRYWLSADVFCGSVGEGVVFLDVRRNRYLGLPQEQARWLADRVADWPLPEGEASQEPDPGDIQAVADTLLHRGILTHEEPRGRTHEQPVKARLALRRIDIFKAPCRIRGLSCARFTLAYLSGLLLFKFCPFSKMVAYLRWRKLTAAHCVEVSQERLVQLLSQFFRLRALTYTASDRCVLDGLVLTEFLHLNGVAASFIIGVQTRPFGAHCWIQSGATILNDTLERVTYFSPLLSL